LIWMCSPFPAGRAQAVMRMLRRYLALSKGNPQVAMEIAWRKILTDAGLL
jgi:hypothetical protein